MNKRITLSFNSLNWVYPIYSKYVASDDSYNSKEYNLLFIKLKIRNSL